MQILIPVMRQIPLEEATYEEKITAAKNSSDVVLCEALANEGNIDINMEILKNKNFTFLNKYYWLHENTNEKIQSLLWYYAKNEMKRNRSATAVWYFLRQMFDGPYDIKNDDMVKAVFSIWYFFATITHCDSDTWHTGIAKNYIKDNVFGDEKEDKKW